MVTGGSLLNRAQTAAVPREERNGGSRTMRAITPAMLRLAVGIAATSFCFPVYNALLLYRPPGLYFSEGLPQWEFLSSVVLSFVVALVIVVAVCLAAARAGVPARATERILTGALILGAALVLHTRPVLDLRVTWAAALAGAAVCTSGTRWGEAARGFLSHVCLVIAMSAFAVLGYEVAAAVLSLPQPGASSFRATAPKARAIIVLLFDEFDQDLAFRLRPARVALPHLERFETEALHATRVSPVAKLTTKAIPSLLNGWRIAQAEPRSARELELRRAGEEERALDAGQTLFAKLRAQGINAAALGWHLPYCRVFASELAACESHPNIDATATGRTAFYYSRRGVNLFAPFTRPTLLHLADQYNSVAREQYRRYQKGLRTLLSWIGDRRLGFIWGHFPYPHPPGMASAQAPGGRLNYFDNLRFVDHTVGAVVAELKRTGRWQDSIVVITGDHGLRRDIWQDRPVWTAEEDHLLSRRLAEYVPLIAHLPGQTEHVSFAEPVSALVLHDLILEWAQGRLAAPQALASWLAGRSARQ